MTKAELRTATQNLVRNYIGSAGTWLGSGNTIIDEFLEDALEEVVLDIMRVRQERFLKSKTISLVADQQNYSLKATYTADTISFNSDSDEISDTDSGFITAGFKVGMIIQASGTTNNNNTDYLIKSITASTIAVDSDKNGVTTEVAGSDFTLTQMDDIWMIRTIQRNVDDKSAKEIEILELDEKYLFGNVGDTEATPMQAMLIEDEIYFVNTPSTDTTDYAKAWFVRPEAFNLPTYGPSYLPRAAHRLVAYKAASKISVMKKSSPAIFEAFYKERFEKIKKVLRAYDQQKPMFVKESLAGRIAHDDREAAFYDLDWMD